MLSDSPESFYSNSDTNYFTLVDPLTLNFNSAYLQFKSYWEIEPNFDFAIVEISPDSGVTWEKLDAKRMTEGSGIKDAIIKTNETGFTGYSHNWVESTIPLNDYLGKSVLLRFGLLSDKGANASGWLIDDLKIKVYYDLTNVVEKEVLQSIFYPNPSELYNHISVNNYFSSNFRIIEICDLIGNKYDFVFNPSSSELHIINPVTGVYYIRYEIDTQIICCKLILY